MYFEVFLEIVIAAFAVFGLFSLVELIGETYFRSEKVVLAVFVDEEHVANELQAYVREARESCFLRGKSEILVILDQRFATQEILGWLNRKKIRYVLTE